MRVKHALPGQQRAVHQQMYSPGGLLVPGHVPQRPAVCANNQPGKTQGLNEDSKLPSLKLSKPADYVLVSSEV